MKLIVKTAFILCFFFLFACSETTVTSNEVDTLKVTIKKINSEKIELSSAPLYPKGCLLIDSLLVIYEEQQEEDFIKIYNLKNNTLIKKTGKIGKGPCDFSEVRFLAEMHLSLPKRHFAIGDTQKIKILSVDSLLNGYNNCENAIIHKIPKPIMGYNYLLQDTDDFIVANITGENQLSFYNKKTNELEGRNYYQPNSQIASLSKFNLTNNLYNACFSAKQDTIAIAYNNFKQIDLVTSGGTLIKNLVFPDFDKNISKIKVIDNLNLKIEAGNLYYTFVYPMKDEFYALCWDGTKKEIQDGEVFPKIHVFDWKGNLKEIIELDAPVSYFCIDEEKKQLYAIAMNLQEFELEIRKAILNK